MCPSSRWPSTSTEVGPPASLLWKPQGLGVRLAPSLGVIGCSFWEEAYQGPVVGPGQTQFPETALSPWEDSLGGGGVVRIERARVAVREGDLFLYIDEIT